MDRDYLEDDDWPPTLTGCSYKLVIAPLGQVIKCCGCAGVIIVAFCALLGSCVSLFK